MGLDPLLVAMCMYCALHAYDIEWETDSSRRTFKKHQNENNSK